MLHARWALAALFLGGYAAPALAQTVTAELVADFDQEPASYPRTGLDGLVSLGEFALYAWDDGLHGSEPWISDGTDAGTRLLADLCPGACPSVPYDFAAAPGQAFFLATEGAPGPVLFSTDGVQLRRHGRITPRLGPVLGDSLYYLDRVPWTNNELPFELWRVSGSTGEKKRLALIASGSDLPSLEAAGGKLFVSTTTSLDVLLPGEEELQRIGPWRGVDFVQLSSGLTVFRAFEGPLGVAGNGRPPAPRFRLWVSDGTAAGTRSLGGPDFYSKIVALGTKAYLVDSNQIVYQTDGQNVGISGDLAIPAGTPYELLGATSQTIYYLANQRLYAYGPGGRQQLADHVLRLAGALADGRAVLVDPANNDIFVSNGSPAGTRLLGRVPNLRDRRATTRDGLLFQASSGNTDLWRATGDAVAIFPTLGPPASSFPKLHRQGNRLVAETTQLFGVPNLFELLPGGGTTPIGSANFKVLGAPSSGLVLRDQRTWRTFSLRDGALEDLEIVGVENPSQVTADGLLYFTDSGLGQKLWESDGTRAGTRVLVDSRPDYQRFCGVIPVPPEDCFPDFPYDIEKSANTFFFVAELPDHHLSAMAYKSTSQQLVQLTTNSSPYAWVSMTALPAGRAAFLRYWDEYSNSFPNEVIGHRLELWNTDGTQPGTSRLLELSHGSPLFPETQVLFAHGERLFFRVPQAGGDELWTSHPATGTAKLADFGAISYDAGSFLALGEKVVFQAATADRGRELWQSDGTAAGTRLVVDLLAGEKGSNPSSLTALGDGRFVFAADDGLHGHELWISDGSAAGTRFVADIAPGFSSGSPSHFQRVGDWLYFQAGREDVGRELFRVPVPPSVPPCAAEKLCLRGGRFEVTVTVKTPAGQVVQARRVFAAEAAGMFTFFSESNWEMMVKVLDGCALNNHFWVFAAAATDLQHTLTVKDLEAGSERSWTSPAGPAKAITDSSAFATCISPANL